MFRWFFIFVYLFLFCIQCSDLGYGFRTNKKIGNLLLSTVSGKQPLYTFNATGYLLFFGYSRCNTTCPMGLQTFSKIFTNSNFPNGILPIFISIDLSRDTWENLERLKENYGARIVFVLPDSVEELTALTKEFEVQFSKSNPIESNYEINHTSNIFFLDSNFKLSRIFTTVHRDTEKIVNEISNFYKENKL